MRRTKALERLGVCLALLIVPVAVNADGDDGRLRVEVLNIENDKGQIGCSLYAKPDGFPSRSDKAVESVFVKPKARQATCVFARVKPGAYAVSVMHDLNSDGKLETSIVGRPKEPWGVSNDAPAQRFGPPKFEAAKFDYDGEKKTLKVKLRQ